MVKFISMYTVLNGTCHVFLSQKLKLKWEKCGNFAGSRSITRNKCKISGINARSTVKIVDSFCIPKQRDTS